MQDVLKDVVAQLSGHGVKTGTPVAGDRKINCLVIGPSSTGKTYACRTLPMIDKCVLVNAEKGDASLIGSGIPMVDLSDIAKRSDENSRWSMYVQTISTLAASEEVKLIIVDTLTEVSDWLMEDILHHDGKEEPTLPTYGKFGKQMSQHVRYLRDVPKHVILLAHDKTEKDEVEGVLIRRPNVVGSLKDTIEREFDIVLYSDTTKKRKKEEEVKYIWRTERTPSFPAKDRFGVLPKPVMYQNWTEVFKAIKKKKGA